MFVFQLPRNLKAKALKNDGSKDDPFLLGVCFTWCHSEKPFVCKGAIPGWWHITLQPGFIVPLETSWNIVSFITPLASHELQEHGDIPWQPQATSWKWVKNHLPGGVKLEYANGVKIGHAWHVRSSMWATLMPAVKKWAHTYLFIDHIEEVNMYSHVQNPFL